MAGKVSMQMALQPNEKVYKRVPKDSNAQRCRTLRDSKILSEKEKT